MSIIHLLHVDDEPDIREIVEISLGLDPTIALRSCDSGLEALAVAADWLPDLILLDVMMPAMDGPATLAGLRANPATAGIPVIFMTARAQTRELDRFRSLGAVGVIAKPFDPMTLAVSVRHYGRPVADPLATVRAGFLQRVDKDGTTLVELRAARRDGRGTSDTLAAIRQVAHGLAGAAGIFGFADIGEAAATLEEAVMAPAAAAPIDDALDRLIHHCSHDDQSQCRAPRALPRAEVSWPHPPG